MDINDLNLDDLLAGIDLDSTLEETFQARKAEIRAEKLREAHLESLNAAAREKLKTKTWTPLEIHLHINLNTCKNCHTATPIPTSKFLLHQQQSNYSGDGNPPTWDMSLSLESAHEFIHQHKLPLVEIHNKNSIEFCAQCALDLMAGDGE